MHRLLCSISITTGGMTFLWGLKRPSGVIDYYLRRTQRVDGKPKVVMNIYLGTADRILELYQRGGVADEDFRLISFQFGTIAAIASADRELGFTEIVRDVTKSDATADALLSFVCGRSEEPLSKSAMEEWSRRSALRFLRALPSLSSRSYLRYMDRLTQEHVSQVSFRIAKKLIEMGHDPSIVFFDTTNFSTEQQPRDGEERTLPRPGHAKDHNSQARLVGLATATTGGPNFLPVMHETYEGNEQDVTVFQRTIDSMIETLQKLGVRCEDICFVFDKGMNSEDGFSALTGSDAHFVSSLKRNQVEEGLLRLGPGDYTGAYETEQGEEIRTLRRGKEVTVMGVNGIVVLAYNSAAERRQHEDYQSARRRFVEGCENISRSLASRNNNEHRRGRPPTVEGTTRRVIALAPEKWRRVFRFRVGNTLDSDEKITLTYWVDAKAEREKMKGFGRTAVFTDMVDWDDEKIVRTYFARGGMEEDYHVLKDALLFPVMPIYHRLDPRIRAHVFMCVMGLLFYRYMQWRIEKETGDRIPIARMVSDLKRIRLGGLITKNGARYDGDGKRRKRIRFKLEDMGEEEKKIVGVFKMEEFVPN